MIREVIAVTGATGFIGRRLVKALAARSQVDVRALVRDGGDHRLEHAGVVVVAGDMRAPATFEPLISDGCTWINLASLHSLRESDETTLMAELVAICRRRGVKRIVHCSTAVVVGRAPVDVVSEVTNCEPASTYEIRKLAVERLLLGYAQDEVEITALRPTAVFGPGGRNLIKLAHDLLHRSPWINYLKSCVQGRRRMNLVCVQNVVAALIFLATSKADVAGQSFLVSDDEDASNNYQDVERALMRGLGTPRYAIDPVPLPPAALSFALRTLSRPNIRPLRVYDCTKILDRGFTKPVSLQQGLREFIDWYRQTHRVSAL